MFAGTAALCSSAILVVRVDRAPSLITRRTCFRTACTVPFKNDRSEIISRCEPRPGTKVFWARGVGWAFAAMARALQHLPLSRQNDHDEYGQKLVDMAAALLPLQGPDGCWRPSLLDA